MSDEILDCFVIMPISDPEGYSTGHFGEVYEHIILPSCKAAGFRAYRADENHSSNMIQLDILKQLLDAPMAVCDLSSRNPNVLFELALRQAFDKPVALIQEEGTPRIFDIANIRAQNYKPDFHVGQIPKTIKHISDTIKSTYDECKSGKSSNSIIKLLSVENAVLSDISSDDALNVILDTLVNKVDFLVSRSYTAVNNTPQSEHFSSITDDYFSFIRAEEIFLQLCEIIRELRLKFQSELYVEESLIIDFISIDQIEPMLNIINEDLSILFSGSYISKALFYQADRTLNALSFELIRAKVRDSNGDRMDIPASPVMNAIQLINHLKTQLNR